MKLVTAIIQPHRLEQVKEELYAKHINLMTVTEVLGHGRQKGKSEYYRGQQETGNFLRFIKLEIAINNDFLDDVLTAITTGAKTGEIGDGKIFVVDLYECVRIRTLEKGPDAIG